MENESLPDGLIIRFLSEETTAEEDKTVLEWIDGHPANRAYFEKLQSAWLLIDVKQKSDAVDVNAGWLFVREASTREAFNQEGAKDEASLIHKEHPSALPAVEAVSDIQEYGSFNSFSRRGLYRVMLRVAVAAGVVGILALGFIWERQRLKPPSDLVESGANNISRIASVLRHEENATDEMRKIVLPDGSQVLLSPRSAIEFEEPFTNNRREIVLNGKAEFNVQKDSLNSFIVNSDQLVTTVLGTVFSVTCFTGDNNISIRLYEGSVRVHAAGTATTKLKQAYYLKPGEELVYLRDRQTARVRKVGTVQPAERGILTESFSDEPSIPVTGEGSWYMFNNQPLPQVFERLGILYNAKIRYSKNDLRNLYFIGRFKQTDSLDKILKEIADINDLKISYDEGTITIEK